MTSCMDPRTLENSCAVFNKGKSHIPLCWIFIFTINIYFTSVFLLYIEFNFPRPPETLTTEPIHETTNSSHFLIDESSQTSFLIQMFLSDLQENPAPELCPPVGPVTEGGTSVATGVIEERETDSDMICSEFNMFSEPVTCTKSRQACRAAIDSSSTTASMLNPLDDPLVSSFTDISTLEGGFLQMDEDHTPFPANSPPNSPETPESATFDIQTVLSSNMCDETNCLFDLSQCVSMFTDSSTAVTNTTPQISIPSSPLCPSPLSASSTCDSSPPQSLQLSSFLKDVNLSCLSSEDLENVISSITSLDSDLCSSPSISVSSSFPPSPNNTLPSVAVSDKKSRKRKLSDVSVEERLPAKSRRLSSDSVSSLSTVSEPSLTVESKKKIRREKNNAASVVSRAKRRQRHKDLQAREKELKLANADLREQVDFLTAETERMKNMLLKKLSQK